MGGGGGWRGEIRELDVFADVTVVRVCTLKPGYLVAVPALLLTLAVGSCTHHYPPKTQFLLLNNRGNNSFYHMNSCGDE